MKKSKNKMDTESSNEEEIYNDCNLDSYHNFFMNRLAKSLKEKII